MHHRDRIACLTPASGWSVVLGYVDKETDKVELRLQPVIAFGVVKADDENGDDMVRAFVQYVQYDPYSLSIVAVDSYWDDTVRPLGLIQATTLEGQDRSSWEAMIRHITPCC